MFSDTDCGSSMLVLSITIVEICLIAKTERDKQEYLYSKQDLSLCLSFSVLSYLGLSLCFSGSSGVFEAQRAAHILLDVSHATERESDRMREVLIVVLGAFLCFFLNVVISPVVKIKPPGTLYYK